MLHTDFTKLLRRTCPPCEPRSKSKHQPLRFPALNATLVDKGKIRAFLDFQSTEPTVHVGHLDQCIRMDNVRILETISALETNTQTSGNLTWNRGEVKCVRINFPHAVSQTWVWTTVRFCGIYTDLNMGPGDAEKGNNCRRWRR
jgi:hypothetical protein